MDFKFTEEEDAFRSELSNWLAKELADITSSQRQNSDENWEFTLSMRQKLSQKGWLTMAWPEEYGGQNASHMMQVIFAEEMSYNRAPGRDIFGTRMMAPTLMTWPPLTLHPTSGCTSST